MMGRGNQSLGVPVHWDSRQWVGINFSHPEVVKLQQQCHMQNIIFDLPQTTVSIRFTPDNWFYSFFSGRGRECQYPDSNRRIEGENENDKPASKWRICSSIITSMFAFLMALGHSGFRHGKTLQKGCFYVVVSQGNSGNKVGKW